MTTKLKHKMRSRKSHAHVTPFKSTDKAHHELDIFLKPIFKVHNKRYDSRGKKLTQEDNNE